jgi:hypothetical protein
VDVAVVRDAEAVHRRLDIEIGNSLVLLALRVLCDG